MCAKNSCTPCYEFAIHFSSHFCIVRIDAPCIVAENPSRQNFCSPLMWSMHTFLFSGYMLMCVCLQHYLRISNHSALLGMPIIHLCRFEFRSSWFRVVWFAMPRATTSVDPLRWNMKKAHRKMQSCLSGESLALHVYYAFLQVACSINWKLAICTRTMREA